MLKCDEYCSTHGCQDAHGCAAHRESIEDMHASASLIVDLLFAVAACFAVSTIVQVVMVVFGVWK
jgi:hypothetical protein